MFAVTADTNIWISAFNYGGNPRRLLDLAEAGKIEIAVSDAIIEETRRILRIRFGWPPEDIDEALLDMRRISWHVTPRQTLHVVKDDLSDNRIVECAMEAGSDYLVSGDKHLLRVGSYGLLKVIRLAEFLGMVDAETM